MNDYESKQIKDISRLTVFTEREIYRSYQILKSFKLVNEAVLLAQRQAECLIEISYSIKNAVKMNELPIPNTLTKVLILQWFKLLRPGDVCTTDQIRDYVLRHSKIKPSKKTIQNNVAQLKQDGYVNYQEKRFIQIIK